MPIRGFVANAERKGRYVLNWISVGIALRRPSSMKDSLGRTPPYEWQICVKCKDRAVYYNVYGLCLHCSALEFAGFQLTGEEARIVPKPSANGHAHEEPEPEEAPPEVSLTEMEQLIVTLLEQHKFTMAKIGEMLGLSEEMVSRMYLAALEKVKSSQPSS